MCGLPGLKTWAAARQVRFILLTLQLLQNRCASYTYALEKGQPEAVAVSPTLADGLAVPSVGPHAFEVARHFVDSVHLTSEAKVALAVLRLVEHEKVHNPKLSRPPPVRPVSMT